MSALDVAGRFRFHEVENGHSFRDELLASSCLDADGTDRDHVARWPFWRVRAKRGGREVGPAFPTSFEFSIGAFLVVAPIAFPAATCHLRSR